MGCAALLGVSAVPFNTTLAQEEEALPIEEITVTGTAIKRPNLDSALPIQTITADEFKREGIVNAGDLIASVPAMQGFITESDSVGGSGGGIRTANLRAIGSQYTLSLLDGRRMAPADSGSSIDLSNIPLAAVEQVQILTDGASALYGSDAIAGVVNFILKDSVDETIVTLRSDQPQEDGGARWNFDIVTGFGDVNEDGYSLVASFSHEDQEQLRAIDRDFAKTGFLFFEHEGQTLYFQNSSANAIPGNASVYTEGFGELIRTFNPYALSNGGTCAEHNTPDAETCRFDYTSTLEILPESKRDSLSLNGKLRLTDSMEGFATVLASQYELTARIAPYPSGEVPLPLDSELVQNEVFPHLTPEELAQVGEVTGTWRAVPAGNRTTEYLIDSMNFTLGVEGDVNEIGYLASVTHATTEIDQNYPTGWLLLDEFVAAASSGAFNIFATPDGFTEEDQAALAPTIYHGDWDLTKNTMIGVNLQASKPLFDIGGGEVVLASGVDYYTTNYDRSISEANANEDLLFLSKDTPYD
ncbi:MAG: TonB-dependent receptor plug domain-containing protein, partial [Woeseiaceae bacterium]